MHARPLPRILEVAFNVVSRDFGGGRIGTVTFLLTMTMSFPEGEGQALFLTTTVCSSGEEGQALLLTLPACSSEEEGQALFLTMAARSTSTC